MKLSSRCLIALALFSSGCPKDADEPLRDAGTEPAGKDGGGVSTSSGAGGAGSSAGRGGARSTAGRGGAGSSAGRSGAGSAAESGKGGASDADAGSCDADCEAGEHCELVQVTCVRAPCPPLPMCVPDGTGNQPGPLDCDPRKITCKRTAPECPEGQVPSVSGGCYGDCVDVDVCPCAGPEACPLHEKYTCNMSAKHCTPYVE